MHTVIYFTAAWCKPCKKFAPIMAQIVNEHRIDYVMQYNVTEQPGSVGSDVAAMYHVMELPTFLLMSDGVEVERIVGVPDDTEQRLREWLS